MTGLSTRDLTEARRLAKKAGGWDQLRRLAEQGRRPRGRARAEHDADILKLYDDVFKEKDSLPKEVLALSDHARMEWFLKTALVQKADRPGWESALKSGHLGKGTKGTIDKGTIDNIVRRLMRQRRKANRG